MKTTKPLFGIFIVSFSILFHSQAQDPFTNGLVAYYPFNGNANDESGFGRHGTVHGAVLSSDRFSAPTGCYFFNGLSDFIDASTTINDVVNTFTVSMWFNTKNAHFAYPYANFLIWPSHGLQTWGDGSVGAGISAGNDKIQVWEHTADNLVIAVEYFGVLNGWNSVTLTYSNRVPRLYVNGAFVGQGSESSSNPVRPSNGQKYESPYREQGGFGGGQQDASTNQLYRGQIDDARIYNRALSSSEVQQLYEFELGPRVNLIKAVKPSFSGLRLGTNFQLQVSSDLNNWTNEGVPFTATNVSMIYPQYWDVDNWGKLFFRLQVSP